LGSAGPEARSSALSVGRFIRITGRNSRKAWTSGISEARDFVRFALSPRGQDIV